MSMTDITARIRKSDGKLVRVHPDGHEDVLSVPAPVPMTEEEAHAAALSDPDALPSSMRRLRQMPRVKTLRRAMGLTQEEFAARYHIPLGTLRDWEQGRSEPDQPAKAYLQVIARDPDHVYHLLSPKRG